MSILIDVAAEFTGKKAFKQAETATDKLNKSVTNLAKGFVAAFSVSKVLAFSKASIKAAAADQKAQQQLALALKNVGLGRDAATAEGYIQRLQNEFGIVDDKLRPAYQVLAIATRDTAESQRLMGIAMDVSAASGIDLQAVSKALSKAYLGNNTALSKLGVGISKADLKSKSFKEITDQLSLTFAGAATAAASGYQGSLDKLAVSANNVKEIIGVGLLDALQIISGNEGMGKATSAAEKYAQKISDATVGTAYLIEELKKIPGASLALGLLSDPLGINSLLNAAQAFKQQPRPFKTPMTISGQVEVKTAKQITALTKEQSKAQSKILADKKAQANIDKANLALNKGSEIFDMDKIQIAAALTNQAEQLGQATSAAQLLQIANDTARLNVKQSILALEDAIASKDQAAIIAATAKLNEDLKVLNALQNQSIKLTDIKSILDGLKPKDLVNQANLDEALRKIKEMLDLLAKMKFPTTTPTTTPTYTPTTPTAPRDLSTPAKVAAITAKLPASVTTADFFASLTEAEKAQLGGYVPFKGANIPGSMSQAFTPSSVGYGTSGTGRQVPVEANFTFNINAGAVANPDELTGLIQDSIIRLNKQGDYLTTAGAL